MDDEGSGGYFTGGRGVEETRRADKKGLRSGEFIC